ncbi:MAG: 2OG-Fe(II) oxygenase [Chitinophagales bacterium]
MRIFNFLENIFFAFLHKFYVKKFNFLYLDNSKRINLINKIFNQEIDGVIIKQFLSNEELNIFSNNLVKYKNNLTQEREIEWGHTIGEVLYVSSIDTNKYFENAKILKKELIQLFGFDIIDRLKNAISDLNNNITVEIAKSSNGVEYVANTIRFMEPGLGGAIEHVHLANLHGEIPNMATFSHLYDLSGQVSFFIQLQKPEKGGELKLFDLRYSDMPKKFENNLYSDLKVLRYIRSRRTQTVKIDSGDLVLFDGGNIWHSVTPVLGKITRITIGGFANYSKNKEKIIIWS